MKGNWIITREFFFKRDQVRFLPVWSAFGDQYRYHRCIRARRLREQTFLQPPASVPMLISFRKSCSISVHYMVRSLIERANRESTSWYRM